MNNITVDKEGKKVDIIFNRDFYYLDIIKEGIDDFKEVCDSSISNEEGINISLHPKDEGDLNTLGYEFSNYLLSLMKERLLNQNGRN